MGEAGIGNQAYLDLIIAALLSHVRADPHCLAPPRGLRVASALGRILSVLRLRPRGCGNAQTSTNMRFIDVLNDRIAATIDQCSGESLALLDAHYLARVCGDELRRLLVVQMAKMDLGLAKDAVLPVCIGRYRVHTQERVKGYLALQSSSRSPRVLGEAESKGSR